MASHPPFQPTRCRAAAQVRRGSRPCRLHTSSSARAHPASLPTATGTASEETCRPSPTTVDPGAPAPRRARPATISNRRSVQVQHPGHARVGTRLMMLNVASQLGPSSTSQSRQKRGHWPCANRSKNRRLHDELGDLVRRESRPDVRRESAGRQHVDDALSGEVDQQEQRRSSGTGPARSSGAGSRSRPPAPRRTSRRRPGPGQSPAGSGNGATPRRLRRRAAAEHRSTAGAPATTIRAAWPGRSRGRSGRSRSG